MQAGEYFRLETLRMSMVLRITILEPHFEGAQLGPTSLGRDSDEEETTSGRGGGRMLLAGLLLLLGMVVGAARMRSMRSTGTEGAEERTRLAALRR